MKTYPIDLTIELFPTRFHLYLDSVHDVDSDLELDLEDDCLYLPLQRTDAEQNLLYIKTVASLLINTPSYLDCYIDHLKATMLQYLSNIDLNQARQTIELLLARKPKSLAETDVQLLTDYLCRCEDSQPKDEIKIGVNVNSVSAPVLTEFFATKLNISEPTSGHKRSAEDACDGESKYKRKI